VEAMIYTQYIHKMLGSIGEVCEISSEAVLFLLARDKSRVYMNGKNPNTMWE
jgi:hypothetical protein